MPPELGGYHVRSSQAKYMMLALYQSASEGVDAEGGASEPPMVRGPAPSLAVVTALAYGEVRLGGRVRRGSETFQNPHDAAILQILTFHLGPMPLTALTQVLDVAYLSRFEVFGGRGEPIDVDQHTMYMYRACTSTSASPTTHLLALNGRRTGCLVLAS